MSRSRRTAIWALLRSAPRGAALVEFALILPFLILLLVLVIDFGFDGYRLMQVQAAAEAGAQYAVRNPNPWNPTAIAAAVLAATGSSGISAIPAPSQVCGCTDGNSFRNAGPATNGSCGGATPACASGFGIYASVSTRLSYHTMLPYPRLPNPLTLNGQAYRRLN